MARLSVVVMPDTGGQLNVTGDPVRADGWFGSVDGNHTISIQLANFTGRLWIEATLANEPTDTDWFPIWLNQCNEFIQYDAKTSMEGYTFQGNFTFIRARVDRTYISPVPETSEQIRELGSISKILLNH